MRVIYLGSPAFAVAPLEALVEEGYDIISVVTQPDRPAGRKRVLAAPPVKLAAQRLGLPVMQPATLRDPAVIEQLAALQPDVGVVAAYGEILRKAVLNIPPLGYVNIHPSLLPLYRGPTPIAGAILAGDTETGVTIMKLDRGMDSGAILAQTRVPLLPTARTGALTTDLFHLGARMLLDVLPSYASGVLTPQEQEHSQATVTQLLRKEDGQIDWTASALLIERMTRAYDPWPNAFTMWQGQQMKILSASVHPDWSGDAIPGTVVAMLKGPLVATGSGGLELHEVQPAGKRVMSAHDWFTGQRNAIGQHFDRM